MTANHHDQELWEHYFKPCPINVNVLPNACCKYMYKGSDFDFHYCYH